MLIQLLILQLTISEGLPGGLEGEVPVREDHGGHQGPHVQAEAEPRGDHLHPDRGHVRRDRLCNVQFNVIYDLG